MIPEEMKQKVKLIVQELRSFCKHPKCSRTAHEFVANGFKALHKQMTDLHRQLSATAAAARQSSQKAVRAKGGRSKRCLLMMRKLSDHLQRAEHQA